MTTMTKALVLTALLTVAFFPYFVDASGSKHGKTEAPACSKPPALVSKGSLSKEDQEKAKNVRMVGTIAITINEDGTVTEARVLSAPSKDAADLLSHFVKTFKFKPRPGCGDFKTQMNFRDE